MSKKSDPVFINDNITTTLLIVQQKIVSYNDCFIVITPIIIKDSSLFLKGVIDELVPLIVIHDCDRNVIRTQCSGICVLFAEGL